MAAQNASNYQKQNQPDSKILEQEGRVPPQAIEVEEAVLGAMLIEHEAATVALQMLSADDFYKNAHRHIFEVLHDLYERDNPLDLLTVENELRDKGLLEACGGAGYLSELTRSVSSAANIDYHAQIIAEKATKRNLILSCTEIIQESYDSSTDPYDVLDRAEQRVFDLANAKHRSQAKPIGDVLKDTLSYLEDMRGKEGGITGVPTGLAIDELTAGWQNGDMIVIAARPSMGKTAFVLTTARNAALHQDPKLRTKVAVFSLEMSDQSLVQRLLTMEGRINAQSARSGRLKDDEFKRLIDAAGRLFTADIFIDDTPGLSIMELRTKARRLKSEHDIGLVVVDYLQLMSSNSRDAGNREQEIASISRGLKALAKELNVPVIALSQLSRAVETRGGDKRPQLSDLRESGCLAGDTLITLANTGKRVPISKLVNKEGFHVWAIDEQSKCLVKSKVTNAFPTGEKRVYGLTTKLGRSIKATANHKFLTINGWKRLDELDEEECIALPRFVPVKKEHNQTLNNEELALLGHLIGDGCTLPKHVIQYTTREKDLAEVVKKLTVQIFDDEVNPTINPEKSWFQVYLTSTRNHTHGRGSAVSDWLKNLDIWGLRSHEKFVPLKVFEQPNSAIAKFLRHLWTTDGSILMRKGKKPYPSIYYATSSQKLAFDIQSLLLRFEINARVKQVSQGKKGKPQYHIILGGKSDIKTFINKIGTVGKYKTEALQEINRFIEKKLENTNRDIIPNDIWKLYVKSSMKKEAISHRKLHNKLNMAYSGMTIFKQNVSRERALKVANAVNSSELVKLAKSDIYWDQIKSIKFEGTDKVYDLTVPEHHNFIANDIIVHNSIEQDADVVCFLYRPEYYGITTTPEGESTAGLAEVIVGKQRNGPVGSKRLYFVKDYARFENLTTASPQPFDQAKNEDQTDDRDSSPPPMGHNPGPEEENAPF